MCVSVHRRLSIRERRNIHLIIISLILMLCIYLTIDSVEISSNEETNRLKSAVKISICPQLSSSSKGYFRVDFTENSLINSSLICKSSDILLVYILSTAKNLQRRESIRRTWARKKDYQQLINTCFIFLVGLSANKDPKYSSNDEIKHEASIYKDIVQLNINETYQNVVYKEVGALKWSHIYAPQIPFLFKTDDDLIIDTLLLSDIATFFVNNTTNHSYYLQKDKLMKDFVRDMNAVDKYTFFRGRDFGGVKTFRSGKFGIHQLAWNHEKLPPYCSGFGFLYSSFIRDRLYRASLCYATEYVPLVGDVFLSGFLAGAASVRCSGWPLINMQTGDACGPLFERNSRLLVCSTPLHKGRQVYSDFDISWQSILRRHNIAFKPIPTTATISNKIPLLNNNKKIDSIKQPQNNPIPLRHSFNQTKRLNMNPFQFNNRNQKQNLYRQNQTKQ